MYKKLLTTAALAVACILPTAAAQADCFGCNIVDEGRLARLQPGHTVYVDNVAEANTRLRVIQVDTLNRRILAANALGIERWYPARELYSGARVEERDGMTWAVGLGTFLLLALGGDSNPSAGSAAGDGQPGSTAPGFNWDVYNQSRAASEARQDEPEPARPDTSAGCIWGDRAYGTCH